MYSSGLNVPLSIILGRTICGWLCPVGLLQELLYKIRSPKLKKSKVTRALSYFKYVLLFVLVILLPLIYGLQEKNIALPGFCKYICPAGTFEGAILLLSNIGNADFFAMLGGLFTWKFILLVIFAVASVFIYRFFCRFFCPLGAIYGIFNKLSIIGVKVDKDKCDSCQACINYCKMDVKTVGDHECIQCGECRKVCHVNAIEWKTIHKLVKNDLDKNEESVETTDNEKKKIKKITPKQYNIISAIVASLILIVVIVVVNFPKKIYEINDVCDEFVVEVSGGTVFDISSDEKATLIYFSNDLTNENIETLNGYSHENLNIILILNENLNDLTKLDQSVMVVVDDESKISKLFTKNVSKEYSVFIDTHDVILISKNSLITDEEFLTIILPSASGKKIGNEVGNICYNKHINIVNSDETFSIASNNGKITVINFWATWCGPCVEELPYFDEVYKEYTDKIEIIAIHEGSTYRGESTIDFINEWFEGFEIKFGYDDENIKESYCTFLFGEGVALPTTLIVDEDGIICYKRIGSITKDELKGEIEKILNK